MGVSVQSCVGIYDEVFNFIIDDIASVQGGSIFGPNSYYEVIVIKDEGLEN